MILWGPPKCGGPGPRPTRSTLKSIPATLDLANFYYQHGLKTADIQYLATNHPYKGLRVYTCEPKGLRGASEHGYERLSRVYGDLCQDGKMTRQADGLFVGGQTLQ